MSLKPIIFNSEMVREVTDNQRREVKAIINPQPGENEELHFYHFSTCCSLYEKGRFDPETGRGTDKKIYAPYKPGDLLWVQESWAHDARSIEECRRDNEDALGPSLYVGPYFGADPVHQNTGLTWLPAEDMPKWVCRTWLRVVSVDVDYHMPKVLKPEEWQWIWIYKFELCEQPNGWPYVK